MSNLSDGLSSCLTHPEEMSMPIYGCLSSYTPACVAPLRVLHA